MVSVKGLIVRSNEKRIVDGIEVQRITVEKGKKKTLCLLSGEQTGKAEAGELVEVHGESKKFSFEDRSFGKYLLATKLEKLMPANI